MTTEKTEELSKINILTITRPIYGQDELNSELSYRKPKKNAIKKLFTKSMECKASQCFFNAIPILFWLPNYAWHRDLVPDIITGCTVAIMHIPQGMGYALLANVPPIVGIYTAFFPVLIYTLLGTSKHNSMGTFAVVTIMVGKVVQNYTSDEYNAIDIAVVVCLISGIIQIVMYIFRLGIVTSLLSDTLVSGLTTGAAIHVVTSQAKDLLGLTIPKVSNYFEIINTYINIFREITNVNWVAICLSVTTMCILMFNNEILKQFVGKYCSFPIPMELILVLSGTLVSQYLFLNEDYEVKIIGSIPTGFPEFSTPDMNLFPKLFVETIPIAMVGFTLSVSMAIIFAQKLNYEVDSNQELLAMGAANIFGSFFSCVPMAASLSRSTIQQTVGGKTQIASLISCSLLAIVLIWIGPFFEPLPRCVLAGIIVVSLKGMLKQMTQLKIFWNQSRLDAFIWLATFLSVVLIAIDIGLFVGFILNILCVFFRGIKPYTCILGNIPKTDLYLDINRYKRAEECLNIKIFHYCGSINFASREIFRNSVCSRVNIDLTKEAKNISTAGQSNGISNNTSFKYLILDFSAVSYIDPSGVKALKNLVKDFNKILITVYIAGSSCPVYETMTKCGLKETEDEKLKFFPTIHDAVENSKEILSPITIISEHL